MSNRRPITMYDAILRSEEGTEASPYSVLLKKESKDKLIRLLGDDCQTFCTANAKVSLKSGTDVLARHSGHLCLVRTKNNGGKQLWLFDLDKCESIWKQRLNSDTMELTEHEKNFIIVKIDDDQTVKMKFKTDYEAEEFFANIKMTIQVKLLERRAVSMMITHFEGQHRRKSLSAGNIVKLSEIPESEEQLVCPSCLHANHEFNTKSSNVNHSFSVGNIDISDPYNLQHVYHIHADCKYLAGMKLFESMPTLVAPPVLQDNNVEPMLKTKLLSVPSRKLTKDDIGSPFDFKHVEHVGMTTVHK